MYKVVDLKNYPLKGYEGGKKVFELYQPCKIVSLLACFSSPRGWVKVVLDNAAEIYMKPEDMQELRDGAVKLIEYNDTDLRYTVGIVKSLDDLKSIEIYVGNDESSGITLKRLYGLIKVE